MKKNNFVVLGGGTAGWLSALFLQRSFPESNVTLVRSKEIGIVGVGEATTPNITNFLRFLQIDFRDLINYTNGSIKLGINFENWNGDDKKFFHAFGDGIVDFQMPDIFSSQCDEFYIKNVINKKLPLEEYHYNTKLAYAKKIDLDRTNWALHFDATSMANFLEEVGKNRNINVVEGEYNFSNLDEQGFVKSIVLQDGRKIDLDFIFDCTGFKRLLIGELYKQNWICYKKYLPMKKGIPFWLEKESDIEPYSTATAMKYGWIWKIPLQHRTGSGYIFDSDYINEDQALAEAEKHFNQKLKVNRVIDFEPGRFENFWVKNCIAFGLSSSFVEPLEATSIFLTIGGLETLRHFFNELSNPTETGIKLYNEIVGNNMDDTLDFVYLHYMTKRKDSEFWKNFKENHPPTERIKNILYLLKSGNIRYHNIVKTNTSASFNLISFLMVANGLDIIEKPWISEYYENLNPSISDYKTMIDYHFIYSIKHKDFLNSIKNEVLK
jgi:tryptophan 7-halogenase